MVGTAAAQVITFAVLPLLTRLYTPQDFEILAVYASLVGIFAVVGCLRFDIAIPIPREDGVAASVLVLALLSVALISTVVGVLSYAALPPLLERLNQPGLGPYLWLVPFGIAASAAYSALQYWAIRKQRFSMIARTRVIQSSGGGATQVGLAVFGFGPLGLIIGQVVTLGAGTVSFAREMLRRDRVELQAVGVTTLKSAYSSYDRFPRLSSLEALANSTGYFLPVVAIAALTTGPEAGFLFLAQRVMQAPSGLLAAAVGQVYVGRAAEEHRASQLGEFTGRVLLRLVRIGVGPLLFAGIVAPDVFAAVFGEEWRRAGVLVTWLTASIVLQFLAAPVSMVFNVINRQDRAVGLQVFGLVVRLGAVGIAGLVASQYVSEAYALSGAIFYLVYLVAVAGSIRLPIHRFRSELMRAGMSMLAWSGLGGAIAILM